MSAWCNSSFLGRKSATEPESGQKEEANNIFAHQEEKKKLREKEKKKNIAFQGVVFIGWLQCIISRRKTQHNAKKRVKRRFYFTLEAPKQKYIP